MKETRLPGHNGEAERDGVVALSEGKAARLSRGEVEFRISSQSNRVHNGL
jgi:hypothetical protein